MPDEARQVPVEVRVDTPCSHCGYNLRGLASHGRCPECGHPIQIVEQSELLQFADAGWLERLRFGAGLKLTAIAIAILLGLLTGALVTAGFPMVLMGLAGVVGGALSLWGTLCITAQEPRVSLQEQAVTLRTVVRTLAGVGFVGSVCSGFLQGGGGSVAVGWMAMIGTILSYGSTAAAYGELFYFRRFARRIPEPALVLSTTRIIWLTGIVGGLWVPIVVVALVFGLFRGAGAAPPGATGTAPATSAGSTGWGMTLTFLGCFGVLAALVLFLWYVRLLSKYRKQFREAADLSRIHAAAAQSSVPT